MTRSSRDQLVLDHLPLVGALAADLHFRAAHVPREELCAAGALALVKAADAFDPDLGVPFGAYARRRILGAFADEMRSMDWATRGIRRKVKETTSVRDSLTAGLGRAPSIDEIALVMGVDASRVSESLADASRSVLSLDEPVVQTMAAAIVLPDESAEISEHRELLEHAIEALPDRLRLIVRAVYFEDRPVKELAEQLGVSHSAVSQQRAQAVRLLRAALERHYPDEPEAEAAIPQPARATRDAYFSRIAERERRFAGSFAGEKLTA